MKAYKKRIASPISKMLYQTRKPILMMFSSSLIVDSSPAMHLEEPEREKNLMYTHVLLWF
jgi:hypothetical protein